MMRWDMRQSSAESVLATLMAIAILVAVGIGVALLIFGSRTP